MPISFTKVKLPNGWLGNMSPYQVRYGNKEWRTTEALFQALRFDDAAVKEEIRAVKSPMAAKMKSKRDKAKMVVVPQSEQDQANMSMVLRLKVEQHPDLKQKLLDTGDETIIEDCGKRTSQSSKFWGATLKDGQWVGENVLGRMWMTLREELVSELRTPK
jgi:ribA/ribD-fused uncharacterized protein